MISMLTTFAQINEENPELTIGNGIAGMLVLCAMAGSLTMIAVWITRLAKTGHAIPAANRGVIRVPLPLMVIMAVIASLLAAMAVLSSMIPDDVAAGDISESAVASTDASTTEPDETQELALQTEDKVSSDNPGDATDSSKNPSVNSRDVLNGLISTLFLNLIFCVIIIPFLLLAQPKGRASLDIANTYDPLTQQPADQLHVVPSDAELTEPYQNNLAATNPYAAPVISANAAAEAHSSALQNHDPINDSNTVEWLDELAGYGQTSKLASEPFSLLTEIRWAGEVFLAAYLPTSVTLILIKVVFQQITGAMPDSHPFLEMIQAGVSIPILMAIIATAIFVAPVVEELEYRVVLLGGIAQRGHRMLAIVFSSLLFAFAHGFPDSLALVILAGALAYAYMQRRSYITVILVHFFFNAFNMMLAVAAMF